MAHKLRYLILAAMVLVIGVGVTFLVLRAHLLERPEMILDQVLSNVDLSLKNIDYTQITDGRKEWTLKATQVDFQKDKNLFSLKNITVILFRDNGQKITMTGEQGYYDRNRNWVRVEGRVRADSEDGYHFSGRAFEFDINARLLTSPESVYISGPGFRIKGQGLEVDIPAWKFTLKDNVVTELAKDGVKSGV